MTIIVAHIGAVIAAGGALVAVIAAWLHGNSTGGALVAVIAAWLHGNSTGKATATDAVKAAICAAQSKTVAAQQKAAQAVADAEEAQKTGAAVKVAQQAHANAGAMTSDWLDAEAASLGILRKDRPCDT